jgi:hypothetical protein
MKFRPPASRIGLPGVLYRLAERGGNAMGHLGLKVGMLSFGQMRQLQRDQHAHDQRNHSDIWSLHRFERLRHYGLHFAKYVGRIARGTTEPKLVARTLTDTFLISLSAANTLHQDFSAEVLVSDQFVIEGDPLRVFADAAGRFADACEKHDHLEEFGKMVRTANRDIARWVIAMADENHIDLVDNVIARRRELAGKMFYIAD